MTSFLFRLYGHCFVDELMLIYPFYAVMFVDHGLTALQISTLLAVWCATTLVLEVPSGVLADRHSRKKIMVIGAVLRACGYGCWALFPNFWGFLVGFVLWGIEGALGSGAFEALVYDELKHFGRENEYAMILGRCRSLGLVGIVVSGVIASFVVSHGYLPLILGSSTAAIVAGALLMSLPAAAPGTQVGGVGFSTYVATLKSGVGEVMLRPDVRHIVVFAALALALGGTLEEYWPILISEMGVRPYALGLFLSLMCGVQALASFIAHRFVEMPSRPIFALFAISGLLLSVAAWSMQIAAVALILLFVFVFQTIDVVYDARLQSCIASDYRATASSVRSFFAEVGGIVVVMALGALVTSKSYQIGFLWFGIVIIVVGLAYLVMGTRGMPTADRQQAAGGAATRG